MERGNIQPKQRVLIYGASGTSGTIAVQYAKYLGAEVSAACGAKNIQFVKSLGADKALDYADEASISKLEEYDFVLDAVGKSRTSKLKEACKRAVADKAKFISIDDGPLILSSERLDRIRELVESGRIRPINDKCYPFEQIVEAHRYVELGHKRGNVAIIVNN